MVGIDIDEGTDRGGPETLLPLRLPLYQKAARIDSGGGPTAASHYERLETMRAAQAAKKQPRATTASRSFRRKIRGRGECDRSVRFAMRKEGQTVLDDVVRGKVVFENKLQDDFVMMKSDGYPTYHLGVVVDDTEMEITHAIRGDEWISSAPKHIQLYEALGWEPPVWAHLPLILGPDKKKLSKRSGDTALLDYRENGYLREAMINFLAFLGWSLDDHTNVISVDELTEHSTPRVVANPRVRIERRTSQRALHSRDGAGTLDRSDR